MAIAVCHVFHHVGQGLHHIRRGVDVDAPPFGDAVVDRLAIVDQLLNGMRQVVLAVGDRMDLLNRREDARGKGIHARARVGPSRNLRPLLDQADAVAVHADHGVLAMITACAHGKDASA